MIIALCISTVAYCILFLSLLGWGRLTASVLKIDFTPDKHLFAFAWLGFSTVLWVLQILHIRFPISMPVSTCVLGTGLLLSLPWVVRGTKKIRRLLGRHPVFPGIYGILVIGFALWIAARGMLLPINPDSGVYHFASIRWLNEYPLVFGIGNLHARLAFNQTYFSFVALLNFYPYGNIGHNLANSFLILLLLAECLWKGIYVISPENKEKPYAASTVFSLFLIPVLLFYSWTTSISSPSPDIAIFLLQILLFRYLITLLESRKEQLSTFKFLLIMSVCAITCKLSIVAYAFSVCLVAVARILSEKKTVARLSRETNRALLLSVMILAVWCARGIAQSGAPFYPSTFMRINADWSMPKEKIQDEANGVYSCARRPGANWNEVSRNWDWFFPWVIRTFKHRHVLYSIVLWVAGIGVLLLKRRFSETDDRPISPRMRVVLYIPLMAALCFWFLTAPDPRFAGSLFYLLAAMPWIHVYSGERSRARDIVVAALFFILSLSPILAAITHFHPISPNGYQPITRVPTTPRTTDSGLVVYIPRIEYLPELKQNSPSSVIHVFFKSQNNILDSPLPATPIFDPKLRLRGESFRNGFSVLPPE